MIGKNLVCAAAFAALFWMACQINCGYPAEKPYFCGDFILFTGIA